MRLGTAYGGGWMCLDQVHHGGMGHMAGYDKVQPPGMAQQLGLAAVV